MSYQGNIPASNFESPKKDRFTGISGTTCSLTYAVSSVADIIVWVNSVKQDFTNYSVSGNTLTLGGTLVSADIVEVTYVGRTFQSVNPSASSVNTSQLVDDAVTSAKLSSTAVDNTNTNSTLITAQTEKSSLVDADKFLISDSAASGALKYVEKSNLGAGGLVKIVEKTVDSGVSEVVFQNVFTSTYRKYLLVASMIRTSSDATINLRFLQADGTSEFDGAYYNFVSAGRDNGGNFESDQGNGDTKLVFCTGGADADSSSDGGMSGAFYFLEPYSTSFSARVTGTYQWRNASNEYVAQYFGGKYSGTAIRTGFKLYPGSGNIAKCYATLYGVIN